MPQWRATLSLPGSLLQASFAALLAGASRYLLLDRFHLSLEKFLGCGRELEAERSPGARCFHVWNVGVGGVMAEATRVLQREFINVENGL